MDVRGYHQFLFCFCTHLLHRCVGYNFVVPVRLCGSRAIESMFEDLCKYERVVLFVARQCLGAIGRK